MKLKILLAICLVFSLNSGFSQTTNSEYKPIELKKNVIYGTLGIDYWEFYGTLMGNYERMIFQLPKSFVNSVWVRVGAGPWAWWTGEGINYVSTLSVLTGRKSAHLEIGSGLLITYNSDHNSYHPLINNSYLAGNLGFRYQKPGGNFVFRTGMGWPEFMYLSLGVCF
jgi:hypothetical protein